MKSLPTPLRWLLAILLILNGAAAPAVTAHAAMIQDHDAAAHATSMKCHHHNGATSSPSVRHKQDKCPCCINGDACQCSCVVTMALPILVPELRAIDPQMLAESFNLQEHSVAPLHRPLRPPIV